MPIGSGILIFPALGFVETEPFDNCSRTEIKDHLCFFLNLSVAEAVFCRVVGIDVD